jgi:hypothetical protein
LFYSGLGVPQKHPSLYGAVAQLIERVVRNDEVVGLIPICSTILRQSFATMEDFLRSRSTGRPFIFGANAAFDEGLSWKVVHGLCEPWDFLSNFDEVDDPLRLASKLLLRSAKTDRNSLSSL